MGKANYLKEKKIPKDGSITFRMTQDDKNMLFKFCDENCISVSMFIEKLILEKIKNK